MSTKYWNVKYEYRDGDVGKVIIEWPGTPTNETAAIRLRDQLLPNALLVDVPRGHPEPTVYMINKYGYTITEITEVTE